MTGVQVGYSIDFPCPEFTSPGFITILTLYLCLSGDDLKKHPIYVMLDYVITFSCNSLLAVVSL